jgi:hypothetical protein
MTENAQKPVEVTMYALALEGNIDWETLDYTVAAVEEARQEFLVPEAWQRVRVEAVITPDEKESA